MVSLNFLPVYVGAAAGLVTLHQWRKRRHNLAAAKQLQESVQAGLNEPPSLHPVVDPNHCIGSGACARACPEGALGIVDGKAALINAAACIGHGACFAACPVQALSLVFGTEKRGIDIPQVTEEFETNVPGMFIAGELGGMGLIRKTTVQGRQAMATIRKRVSKKIDALDVVIVGAGPAGISAGLSALHHQLRYAIIEQEDSLGGAVYHYPRNKITMTAPFELDLIGTVKLGTEVQKEKLLAFWNDVVQRTGLKFQFNERMEGIERNAAGLFEVITNKRRYTTQTVLLALGRRGTPRKLEVPGEQQAKVVYRLIDPEQYRGLRVLVVGGGDSALEAAISLAEQPGTQVTLSYRGESFARVKEKNRLTLQQLQTQQRLRVILRSVVLEVEETSVRLRADADDIKLPNDVVIVCAGGLLPTPLLKSVGIHFETKHGTA